MITGQIFLFFASISLTAMKKCDIIALHFITIKRVRRKKSGLKVLRFVAKRAEKLVDS